MAVIDPNSHVPIYRQIVEYVHGVVAAGVFVAGDALPSIRALALDLVVNPNTVQRAYQELEREGLLETRRGLGAFVSTNGSLSAQRASEATVRERLAEAVAVGRAARVPTSRLETLFREVLAAADGATGQRS